MQGFKKKDKDLEDTTAVEMQPPNKDNVLYPNSDEPPKQESTLPPSIDEPPKQESTLYSNFDGSPLQENMSSLTADARNENLSSSSSKPLIGYQRRFKKANSMAAKFDSSSQKSPAGNQQQNSSSESARFVDSSKKLEDEMQEWGLKIKHYEDNTRYLKTVINQLDQEIMNCETAAASTNRVKSDEDSSTEEVIISKCRNTTAALICRMKSKTGDMSNHSLMKDVIGVVATLGTCDDASLSSVLSKFLGLETMLAVVCKTYQGARALETGIHAFAADIMGISLDDRFQVICLDELRRYPGDFIADDRHRRLDLVKPILHGKTPTGFLGFAVNMVSIDSSNMYCMSKAGHTLRETLFYNLFSSLQVYRSREDMLKARPVISNGAVSLDGGVIRTNGVSFMNHQKSDVGVKFSVSPSDLIHSEDYYENEKRLKETKWKKSRTVDDLQREQELLDRAKSTYEVKKHEYLNFLAVGAPYAT